MIAVLVVIWQYDVVPGEEAAFELLYGASGEWVALFREYPGYIGTELLRQARGHRYLTIDRWASERDYDAFLRDAKARYATIDARGDALTSGETLIGRFNTPC